MHVEKGSEEQTSTPPVALGLGSTQKVRHMNVRCDRRKKACSLFMLKVRPLPFCWNLEPNGATEYLPYRSLARLHILSQRAHLRVHGPCYFYFYMLSVTRFIQSRITSPH